MTQEPVPLAIAVKGWPRLSETFIAQEILALERAGLRFDIWSLRFPTDGKTHPLHDAVQARVRYLPEYLHQEPGRGRRLQRGFVARDPALDAGIPADSAPGPAPHHAAGAFCHRW
ncbi:MAG: hypothetical protein AAGF56_05030, partial [Pseudomonadota bacterium]